MIPSITDHIDYFMNEFFPKITKEESDSIKDILKWDDEKKAAFLLAKNLFEEECKK